MNKLCLLLLCCIVILKASGQAGSLDSTFGNNGIQTTAFFTNLNLSNEQGLKVLNSPNGGFFVVVNFNYNYTRIIKYLPDGRLDSSYNSTGYSNAVSMSSTSAATQGDKIVVAGRTYNPFTYSSDFALMRYTANGILDSSFGQNGMTIINFSSYSIAIQDDKILAAGYLYNNGTEDFALARYTANGALDASFGENGMVTTDFNNTSEEAYLIVLQENKIVVGGRNWNDDGIVDGALVRYLADGTLDSSFGENGKVITDFHSGYDQPTSIVIQGNKIIVGGVTEDPGNGHTKFGLVRYTAKGKLDYSFGSKGKVRTDFNINSLALHGDKIILAGFTGDFINNDFALARYSADGILDSSFGENGKVATDFNNSEDVVNSIALSGDKIIAAGYAGKTYYGPYDFALASYTIDGILDMSFGESGKITGYFPSSQATYKSTVLQGDKILAVGSATKAYLDLDFALARYTPAGVLDSAFGVNGKITTDFSGSWEEANSVALQGNKIIAAGFTHDYDSTTTYSDFALARYTADGKLDSSFGVNGKTTTDFDNETDVINSIVLQGDKIIAAGYNGYDNPKFALTRYTENGILDSTFGVNGKVTTGFGGDIANAVTLQGNKIIAAGFSNGAIALARYSANGTLDSSFGVNGRVITYLNGSNSVANSISLQGDKIMVGGTITTFGDIDTSHFVLVRYSANGVLDSSFGDNGKVITDLGSYSEEANSIALQQDKIILAGYTYNADTYTRDIALVRYLADGMLDSAFGENGKVTTHLGGSAAVQDIALYQNRLYAAGSFVADATNTYGLVAAYQLEAPEPTISITDVTVQESKKLAVATVRLSAPTNKLVRVHFTTRNKTATSNHDYISISGPLFFIPGLNNTTAKVIIPIIDDNASEGTEQFEIVLSNAHNATIQDSVGVVTIVDDDNALIIKQQGNSLHIQASPNPSANAFTIQLQGSNLKQPISMRVYDVHGRLIEERNSITIGQSLRLGDQYTAGTYIIEAVQGSKKVQAKVIKTGK